MIFSYKRLACSGFSGTACVVPGDHLFPFITCACVDVEQQLTLIRREEMPEPVAIEQTSGTGGVGRVGELAVCLAGDVVKGYLAVGSDHREVQVKKRSEHLDDAIGIAADHHCFPTPLTKALIPDAWPRRSAQAIAHSGRLLV